jgi:hypothetical protein
MFGGNSSGKVRCKRIYYEGPVLSPECRAGGQSGMEMSRKLCTSTLCLGVLCVPHMASLYTR